MNREESKKALISVLWSGADVLRSKMDANEYKDYLLSFVFYKYLSDRYLVKVYDLLNDSTPETIEEAQLAYEEAYNSDEWGVLEVSCEDLLKLYDNNIENSCLGFVINCAGVNISFKENNINRLKNIKTLLENK